MMGITISVLEPVDEEELRDCASCGIPHDPFDLDWDDMCAPCLIEDEELAEHYVQRVRDYQASVL